MQTSSPIGHSKSTSPHDREYSPITRPTIENSNHHTQVPTFSDSSRLNSIENAFPHPHAEIKIRDGVDTEQYVHRYLGNTIPSTVPRGFNYLNAENLERSPHLHRRKKVFRSSSTEDPTYLSYAQRDRYIGTEPEDNLSYECFAESLEKDLSRLERKSSAPESTDDFAYLSGYPHNPKSLFDGQNVAKDSIRSSRYPQKDTFVPTGLKIFHDHPTYSHSRNESKQHIRPEPMKHSVHSSEMYSPIDIEKVDDLAFSPNHQKKKRIIPNRNNVRDSTYMAPFSHSERNYHTGLERVESVNSLQKRMPRDSKYLGLSSPPSAYGEQNLHDNLDMIVRNSYTSIYPFMRREVLTRSDNYRDSTYLPSNLYAEGISRNPMFSRHEMETPKESEYYMCQYEEKESSKVDKKVNSKYKWFCRSCPKKCKKKASLHMHMADKHGVWSPQKNHFCQICSKMFKEKVDLSMHVAVKHGKFGKTEKRNPKSVKYGESLTKNRSKAHTQGRHKLEFKFECNFCQTKFKKERKFKSHCQGNKCKRIRP